MVHILRLLLLWAPGCLPADRRGWPRRGPDLLPSPWDFSSVLTVSLTPAPGGSGVQCDLTCWGLAAWGSRGLLAEEFLGWDGDSTCHRQTDTGAERVRNAGSCGERQDPESREDAQEPEPERQTAEDVRAVGPRLDRHLGFLASLEEAVPVHRHSWCFLLTPVSPGGRPTLSSSPRPPTHIPCIPISPWLCSW